MRSTSAATVGLFLGLALLLNGCAVRLGGPKPETYNAVALVGAEGDPAAVASQLRDVSASLVLLAAPRDSTWFAQVAQLAGLTLSGPGTAAGAAGGLALLSSLKVLGDTALTLAAGAGRLHVMDALYEVDKNRHVDLMLMDVAPGTDARDAVRALLSYYATDVGGTAAVLLALRAPTSQAADSAALLLRSAFGNALACGDDDDPAPGTGGTLRFFYGPKARIDCERGRLLTATPPTILARVVVGR